MLGKETFLRICGIREKKPAISFVRKLWPEQPNPISRLLFKWIWLLLIFNRIKPIANLPAADLFPSSLVRLLLAPLSALMNIYGSNADVH